MTYRLHVHSDGDSGEKSFRPLLRLFIREALKNEILQVRQPHRQAQLDGVSAMIVVFDGAPDGATFALAPADAFDELVGGAVSAYPLYIFIFYFWFIVE